MKTLILSLTILVLTACGGGSGGGSGAVANTEPVFTDPTAPTGGPVVPGQVTLTYYKRTRVEAPHASWPTKTYSSTGNCVTYQTKVYCWDDGIRTLSWSDFNGNNYGPYRYTYFGYDLSNGSWGSCHGGCNGASFFTQPRQMSATIINNMTVTPVNTVFSSGTPITVNCSESATTVSCGDFTIDLTQAVL